MFVFRFRRPSVVATAADKSKVLQLASEIGVPIPKTLVVESADEIEPGVTARRISGGVQAGPLACLERRALDLRRHRVLAQRPMTCAARLQQAADPAIFPVLIQERIQGPGVGVFVCCGQDLAGARDLRAPAPAGEATVRRRQRAVRKCAGGSGREATRHPSAPEHWLARRRHGGVQTGLARWQPRS